MPDIITEARALEFLKEDSASSPDGFTELIDEVEAYVTDWMNRTSIIVAAQTEQHDGGHDFVSLRVPPIASITTVHSDTLLTFGADTLVDSANYTFYPDTGRLQLIGGRKFGRGFRNVKVVYQGGWADADAVPKTIKLGILGIIADIWKEQVGRQGLQGVSFEGQQVQFLLPPAMPAKYERMLRLYRVPPAV
jgi:hypothetical protein